MIAIDMKMPKDCVECVIRDIRDMFGTCPCDFALDHRPPNCPLLEVGKIRCDRLAFDTEPQETTDDVLSKKLAEFICSHPELIQFERDFEREGAIHFGDILLCKRVIAELNVVLPKGAKLNEQD